MNTPKTDDFRLERRDNGLAVTFTPTGHTFTYSLKGDELSAPNVSSGETGTADYAEDDIRKTADELARLAVKGGPAA